MTIPTDGSGIFTARPTPEVVRCDVCGLEVYDFRQRDGRRTCLLCVSSELETARRELLRLVLFVEYCIETADDFDQRLEREVLDRAWRALGASMNEVGHIETPKDLSLERTRLLDELEQLDRSEQARVFAEALKRAGLEE